ncbi:hypothetical protein GLOTRDRAFT_77167 [Gloeophyllum trabeum ATCC 11539]|uniref:BTB domain-containing protein n=1 Tax=Gloeophyllum trabeum (strain ATCC 11539 / FP-39264 / Madison 617) TaxID=670483 RepID=S7RP47_GLOTA|nr:uncharacterized protein GLOTRDRAFT_77167 [Gloeophyllum trabeum ATCC 11539]EPQ54569.1 hypothetical protein GLOTRDRAFT_77167 [Gloeophyllum trabeum ATCC 11539]
MEVPIDKRGDPWFDDGNIVLLTDPDGVAFKVHRGVLSRHSEIFQSMFQMPQPADLAAMETLDGCQVVRMYDPPLELSNLIKALYDGVTFQHRNADDFFHLAGILRLSTKYFIAHLRLQAIKQLTSIWSHTLRGHDEMLDKTLSLPSIPITYPYIHPLHVINLARETNVLIVLPSAFYLLSLHELHDILAGAHPKLHLAHPSKPSSELSLPDTRPYTLMFQHRLSTISEFVHAFCAQRGAAPACEYGAEPCVRGFRKLVGKLSQSWRVRSGPMHFIVQAVLELKENNTVCRPCRKLFKAEAMAFRQRTWDGLPGVIGLPSWEELVARDLESN